MGGTEEWNKSSKGKVKAKILEPWRRWHQPSGSVKSDTGSPLPMRLLGIRLWVLVSCGHYDVRGNGFNLHSLRTYVCVCHCCWIPTTAELSGTTQGGVHLVLNTDHWAWWFLEGKTLLTHLLTLSLTQFALTQRAWWDSAMFLYVKPAVSEPPPPSLCYPN